VSALFWNRRLQATFTVKEKSSIQDRSWQIHVTRLCGSDIVTGFDQQIDRYLPGVTAFDINFLIYTID